LRQGNLEGEVKDIAARSACATGRITGEMRLATTQGMDAVSIYIPATYYPIMSIHKVEPPRVCQRQRNLKK